MVNQTYVLAWIGLLVIYLQEQRSCAIRSLIPRAFMSLSTQFFHVFLGVPLPTTPVTFILEHFFTQSFSSFRSTYPYHLLFKKLCILKCSKYYNFFFWNITRPVLIDYIPASGVANPKAERSLLGGDRD